MKKTILFLFIIGAFSSCNNQRLAELEAETLELRNNVELLTQRLHEAQQLASINKVRAEVAQQAAELAQKQALEQAKKAKEAGNK
jgi:hypothetical protein